MFGLVQASNRSFFWPSDAAQRWPLETVRRVPAKGGAGTCQGGGRVPAKGHFGRKCKNMLCFPLFFWAKGL